LGELGPGGRIILDQILREIWCEGGLEAGYINVEEFLV
jgi:hypothetical protein